MLVITEFVFLLQTFELLAWIPSGMLDVSSRKSFSLNVSETDLHIPHPGQTCCQSYVPFLGNGPPHHPLSNASRALGATWTLLSLPLPTTQQSPTFLSHGLPSLLPWTWISSSPRHLLPGQGSGLPAPYLLATLLPELCLLSLLFLFVEESVYFWIQV